MTAYRIKRPDLPADAPICSSGHIPIRTEEEAQLALRRTQRMRSQSKNSGRKPGESERDYIACKACGWYHLTGATGARRRSYYANQGRRK